MKINYEKILWIRVFLKRFHARFKYLLKFKEMWLWEYESCDRCGKCYKFVAYLKDELWIKIKDDLNGCLCPDCMITLAIKKKIQINIEDFIRLWIFYPNSETGKSVDIIETENIK